MFPVIVQIVAVIEGNFFSRKDVAQRHDPDFIVLELRLRIRRTTVIDKARKVALHTAINVEFLIDVEDVIVAFHAAPQ